MDGKFTVIAMREIDLGDHRRLDFGDIGKLAAGINKIGLLHPLTVRRVGDRFNVVAGSRRYKAVQLLKREHVVVRLYETLTEEEVREIEFEENENRKDFTEHERRRTFAASKRMVEDAKKAAEVISSTPDEKKKDPRGRKAKGKASKDEIAEALGVSKGTLVNAEHHEETAEEFPFMQAEGWRQSNVLAFREQLESIPDTERKDVAVVLGIAKILDPDSAVTMVANIAGMSNTERGALYDLSLSEDPRDRSKALATAAKAPPMPDPRLNSIDTAVQALRRATEPFPKDPLTPAITKVIDVLRGIKKQVRLVSFDARRTEPKGIVQ